MNKFKKIISDSNLPQADREILEEFGRLVGDENLEEVNGWLLENRQNAAWLAENLRQKIQALKNNDMATLTEIFENEFEFLDK